MTPEILMTLLEVNHGTFFECQSGRKEQGEYKKRAELEDALILLNQHHFIEYKEGEYILATRGKNFIKRLFGNAVITVEQFNSLG
jgi:hypothetical protein